MAKRTCSIDGCDRSTHARGWCSKHYLRWKRHGDPSHTDHDRILGSDADRFWPKVDRDGPGGCRLWTAGRDRGGYGTFAAEGRTISAHRWAWESVNGPVPDGLELDHLCRVRHCVNPAHLEPVTHALNVERGTSPASANAAKRHCPRGHPYDHTHPDGSRRCTTCMSEASRRSYVRRKSLAG